MTTMREQCELLAANGNLSCQKILDNWKADDRAKKLDREQAIYKKIREMGIVPVTEEEKTEHDPKDENSSPSSEVGVSDTAPAISEDEDYIDYGTPLTGEKAERIKRVRESVIQFMHGEKK